MISAPGQHSGRLPFSFILCIPPIDACSCPHAHMPATRPPSSTPTFFSLFALLSPPFHPTVLYTRRLVLLSTFLPPPYSHFFPPRHPILPFFPVVLFFHRFPATFSPRPASPRRFCSHSCSSFVGLHFPRVSLTFALPSNSLLVLVGAVVCEVSPFAPSFRPKRSNRTAPCSPRHPSLLLPLFWAHFGIPPTV